MTTLKSKIRDYDELARSMGNSLAGTPAWKADGKKLDKLKVALADHRCSTMGEFNRWLAYANSIGELRAMATPEFNRAERERIRDEFKAKRPKVRPTGTTYEFGIDGSDRLPTAPAEKGWSKRHRRYPFDVMEVGETVTLPGLKRRAQIGGTIQTAEIEHRRKFKCTAVETGLIVGRIA